MDWVNPTYNAFIVFPEHQQWTFRFLKIRVTTVPTDRMYVSYYESLDVVIHYLLLRLWRCMSFRGVKLRNWQMHAVTQTILKCKTLFVTFIWNILIIISRHELGIDRPVSAWSNSLFKGFPSRLGRFVL